MPAKSEKQRRFFAIAESIKAGKTPASYSPAAARIAQTLTAPKIQDFTGKKKQQPGKLSFQ